MKSLNNILSAQANNKRDTLIQGIGQALEWLAVNRQHAPRLEREADRLAIRLLRQHNRASVVARQLPQNCAIGLFGLAQAAKSYLTGALAGSDRGRLECALGNSVLDYATHLNPQQETANLVLRFSGQQHSSDSGWPVQLALLTECEVAAILVLQYQQSRGSRPADKVTFDEQQLADKVHSIAMYRQPETIDGIDRHHMVALWDSAGLSSPPNAALESHFWPQAVELAPHLGVDERARLFSLLWGEDRQLTALYRQLAHTLHHLSSAAQVLAPLSVLDEPRYSLLYSSGVSQFNAATDQTLQVLPRHNGRVLAPVSVALAELTLLSREVLLPLYSSPREALFTEVDLLDYPGLTAPTLRADDQQVELAMSFVQARRPFLLQRAAQQQDVTHLLVCSAADKRNQTRQVGRLLDFWVKQTQGENPASRSGRKPGLIWAMTPFDQRVTHGHHYDAAVQRFVGNPGDAWGAMLAMDDKGVQRMAGYLVSEVRAERKLQRMAALRAEIQRELTGNLLGRWYQAADKENPTERLRIGETLLKALQTRTGVHGELLERLVPLRETLRHLFLQREQLHDRSSVDEYSISEDDPFGIGLSIDLLSDQPLVAIQSSYASTPQVDPEAEFAHGVYHHWVNQLRLLPDNGPLLELLGVAKPTLEMLTEELITASVRLELETALVRVLADSDTQGQPAEQIADRQVSRALSVLGDFVAWLGFQQLPETQRPDSRINRGQKIFAKPEAQTADLGPGQRLTRLALKPNNHAAFYIYDWLIGLNEMIMRNTGYAASREIGSEQRDKLAKILAQIRR